MRRITVEIQMEKILLGATRQIQRKDGRNVMSAIVKMVSLVYISADVQKSERQ